MRRVLFALLTLCGLLWSESVQAQTVTLWRDGQPATLFDVNSAFFSKASQTAPSLPSDGIVTVNGVSFKMVRVSGGTFQMGATAEQGSDAFDSEKPVHSVTLSDFAIGETEVTQALWQAVMGQTPMSDGYQWSSDYGLGADYPAYYVSWNDCQVFISKLNELTGLSFRFPTEAEWEFAARGGNSSQGYKYAGSNTIDDVAWYWDNSSSTTHAVGAKSPNELGLYDMSGNIWEWCQDWYGEYSSGAQTNPAGPASGSDRELRGGGWYDDDWGCRVSLRVNDSPSRRNSGYGMRLALYTISVPTGIDEMKAAQCPFYRITDDGFMATGLPANSPVGLYDLRGVLLAKTFTDGDGRVQLPVSGKGVFVVKTEVSSFKIRK